MSEAARDPSTPAIDRSAVSERHRPPLDFPALPIYSIIPAGLGLVPVVDARNAPALVPGEWAVIDPNIGALEFGAMYVISEILGASTWIVRRPSARWQTIRGKPAVTLATVDPFADLPPSYMGGPAIIEFVMENMVGKVIGIHRPRCFGGLRCAWR
jgi:hypothetical protein